MFSGKARGQRRGSKREKKVKEKKVKEPVVEDARVTEAKEKVTKVCFFFFRFFFNCLSLTRLY